MASVMAKVFGLPLTLLIVLVSLLIYTYQSVRSIDIAQTTQVQENLHEVLESATLDALTNNINANSRRDSVISINILDTPGVLGVKSQIRNTMVQYIQDNGILISYKDDGVFSKENSEETVKKIVDAIVYKNGDSIAKSELKFDPEKPSIKPRAELPTQTIYYKTMTTKAYTGENNSDYYESELSFAVEIDQLLGASYTSDKTDKRDKYTVTRYPVNGEKSGTISITSNSGALDDYYNANSTTDTNAIKGDKSAENNSGENFKYDINSN